MFTLRYTDLFQEIFFHCDYDSIVHLLIAYPLLERVTTTQFWRQKLQRDYGHQNRFDLTLSYEETYRYHVDSRMVSKFNLKRYAKNILPFIDYVFNYHTSIYFYIDTNNDLYYGSLNNGDMIRVDGHWGTTESIKVEGFKAKKLINTRQLLDITGMLWYVSVKQLVLTLKPGEIQVLDSNATHVLSSKGDCHLIDDLTKTFPCKRLLGKNYVIGIADNIYKHNGHGEHQLVNQYPGARYLSNKYLIDSHGDLYRLEWTYHMSYKPVRKHHSYLIDSDDSLYPKPDSESGKSGVNWVLKHLNTDAHISSMKKMYPEYTGQFVAIDKLGDDQLFLDINGVYWILSGRDKSFNKLLIFTHRFRHCMDDDYIVW